MPIHFARSSSQVSPSIQAYGNRLILGATDRVTIATTARLSINNIVEPARDNSVAYDVVNVGVPINSRVNFVVQDGWQLPIFNRMRLRDLVRATVKGCGRILISDGGPRTRLVLNGFGS